MKKIIFEMYQKVKKNIRRLSTLEKVVIVLVLVIVADELIYRYTVKEFESSAQYKA